MSGTRLNKNFKEILENIPENKQYIARNLVNELVFMQKTLDGLKKDINENGAVEHFEQGKQKFLRESPALKSYNAMIQRYSTLYKQLTDLMNKPVETQKSNAVYDFLKEGAAK